MAAILLHERKDALSILTLNRPECLNALSLYLLRALTAALWELDANPAVRVVLLRGAGKAWCAGGDIEELLELTRGSAAARRRYLTTFKGTIEALRGISKPVIAVVHGACIAGGNQLNVACDLTLASEQARFGQAGPRVGSVPVFGIPRDFQHVVGEKRAKEVSYLSRTYTAAEAESMGWINRVVPADQLDATAETWANEIAEKCPASIAISKRLHNAQHSAYAQSVDDGIELLTLFWGTDEAREAFTAFREKRKALFG